MRKNDQALKRSKHKGFCVFLLGKAGLVLLKYGENEQKSAKSSIFGSLKTLQNKGFREIRS